MSILNNSLLLGAPAGATGYQVSRSLRYNREDSPSLTRTPGSAGSRKTFTWAGWVKRSAIGSTRYTLFAAGISSSAETEFFFEQAGGADTLHFYHYSGSYQGQCRTIAVFRDASAWYHIVLAVDTTQATASNRCKIYVNGVQQDTTFTTNFTQNADLYINSTVSHGIGYSPTNSFHFSGYLADIWFLDGIAATPSDFAETDATTGQWIPKAYAGSKPGNSFHLDFSDNSAATAAALGKDSSGNGLNWSPTNFSVTAGAGNDSLTDTPTSYGTGTSGGDVRGNFCTWNPLDNAGLTLSNGNLQTDNTVSAYYSCRGTIKLPSTGKWYFETTVGNPVGAAVRLGVGTAGGATEHFVGVDATQLYTIHPGGSRTYSTSITGAGAVLSVAYDADSQKLWFGFNNSWLDGSTGLTGNPAAGTNPTYTSILDVFPTASQYSASNVNANFGQRAFAYTPPANYKPLVDTYLPSPAITKSNTVFDIKLWTGNGSTQTISGLSFSPDFVWAKSRSQAASHELHDIIRGVNTPLRTNLTDAELSLSGSNATLTSFNSDGFTLGADQFIGGINYSSSYTYVGWCWDAGSSTAATNNSGSIQSTVKVNTSSGFSVLTATTPTSGSSFSVGHGLGVAPAFAIFKDRGYANSWGIYHKSITTTTGGELLFTTAAAQNYGWFPSAPTSTTFTLSVGGWGTGASIVGYLWTPVTNYSAFGSFTGSSDLPFIYTGFKPRWLLLKNAGASGDDWALLDSARNTYNELNSKLWPNTSAAEATLSGNNSVDFLANGFKMRSTNNATNSVGNTMIYAAFAESPFQYARAR